MASVNGSYREYAVQDLFSPVTVATASCDARSVAKGVENPELTAYVRFHLIGDRTDVTALGKELGQNKQWIINVRQGQRGVGARAMQDIANRHFDGSLDALLHAAKVYASKHREHVAAVMVTAAERNRDRAIALVFEDVGTPLKVLRQYAEKIELPPDAPTLQWVRAINDAIEGRPLRGRERPVPSVPTPPAEPRAPGRRRAERDST